VAALPGVSRVELNFAAAKITVEGTADASDVARMGLRHNVQLKAAGATVQKASFWAANPHLLPTGIAGVLSVAGWVAGRMGPEWVSTVLYALAILFGGYHTGVRGIRSLLRLDFNEDTLMVIAVVGAALIGEWSEGSVVAFLFGVSETLEAYTSDRARQSLRALMDLAPKVARVKRGALEAEVAVEDVRVGDTIVIRPGEKIAMDGRVAEGASAVNQAAITGESLPIDKRLGDEVFAGTLNGSGALEVEVTKLVEDSTFARIVHMVEEAQAQRAPTQTFIERFTKYYTPIVMVLATLIIIVPPLLFGQNWVEWIYRGLSLLVISCPCALVISTPVSIVSAISNAARNGVLIKGGAHLERASTIKAIAFDKTGTLTKGRPEVTDVQSLSADHDTAEVLCLAAAVEARSEHPLARAIVNRAGTGEHAHHTVDFQALVGRGATARVDGGAVYVGSPKLFAEELGIPLNGASELVQAWQAEGKTVMLVGGADRIIGALAVADTVRESSADMIRRLKASGITRTVLLTGDNALTAGAIGRLVGVDAVHADLLPQDKVAAIKALTAEHGAVAMVGDGVNDAPALAAATVGIAMGGAGTDVALETADIALMADDLSKLPFTVRLSRYTLTVIKQNIGIALGLKLLAFAAVFPGWLTLWLAIVADMGATIIVTLNGMRLLRVKPQE